MVRIAFNFHQLSIFNVGKDAAAAVASWTGGPNSGPNNFAFSLVQRMNNLQLKTF
jgi:hypothetical protein